MPRLTTQAEVSNPKRKGYDFRVDNQLYRAAIGPGRDIPAATTDYISDQLAVSNYPVGSTNSVRNSLLQYQQLLINQSRKYLRAKYPEAVSVDGMVYGIQA